MSALDDLKALIEEAHLHKLKPEPEPESVKPKVSAEDINEFNRRS